MTHGRGKIRRRCAGFLRTHPAGSERGERYRVANRVAGRFAAQLEARFVAENDRAGLVTELRRFYRKGQRGKLAAAGY